MNSWPSKQRPKVWSIDNPVLPLSTKADEVTPSRESILNRFRDKIANGLPIIGGGAGTGISAKCEEAGGIDLIVIYNSGR
ncbi:MAG: phosphoenolpyruvate hydrolase family protein, partial [Lacipirellulaceae bacterium]